MDALSSVQRAVTHAENSIKTYRSASRHRGLPQKMKRTVIYSEKGEVRHGGRQQPPTQASKKLLFCYSNGIKTAIMKLALFPICKVILNKKPLTLFTFITLLV